MMTPDNSRQAVRGAAVTKTPVGRIDMTESAVGAVVWDVDGTLVDTAELHFAAWVRLCGELGRPFSRDEFAATFGRRNPEIFAHLFGPVHSAAELDDLGFRKEEYYRA